MARSTIDRLIVNSPYEEPAHHWRYDRTTRRFDLAPGRRPAGYVVASEDSRAFDDPGAFVEIPLVNAIRPRVKAWREAGWPGATAVTRRLLRYWNDPEEFETRRFFFCQLEAVETLIWLSEAPAAERVGVEVPSDGGGFERVCAKMATGSGKTVVMAMVLAWHILNKVAHPRDRRFSRNVLVVAPGLTVRSRLAVLEPSHPESYYEAFRVVPSAMLDRLRRGRVVVRNRHALDWEGEERIARRRSVDKRGARSDEAWVRDVLGDMAKARDLLVVNDEAHHAWRIQEQSGSGVRGGSGVGGGSGVAGGSGIGGGSGIAGGSGVGGGSGVTGITGIDKAAIEEATKWVGGLDRIDRARGILRCYDFSATPFAPSGRRSSEEALFGWIVSDFGLNDAIEAGLVKTPRVVVRDDALPDAGTWKSRLYHIYNDPEVKDDLNRRAGAGEPLPDLVLNGYYLLGYDWRETARRWAAAGFEAPPTMITVANRTETAARVKHAFDTGRVRIDELCDPERTLHIDSKVLGEAEAEDAAEPIGAIGDGAAGSNGGTSGGTGAGVGTGTGGKAGTPGEVGTGAGTGVRPRKRNALNAKQRAELLRRQVDTVGRPGQPGGRIRNVISVGMLSEGWDAKTVTHIMGLRAFTSQLLCEQVVGRGLRRTAYEAAPDTGLFEPEYVNVFGVPFTFLPHEGGGDGPPPPPEPKTAIEPDKDKAAFEIRWPNVVRIDRVFRPRLTLDWEKVEPLTLDASQTARLAELAPVVEGKPDMTLLAAIDLERLARELRIQRIVFETARDVYDAMQADWSGSREVLLAQLVRLVERFLGSGRIVIEPRLFAEDDLKRRLMLALNMTRIVQHLWQAIRFENAERLTPVFDRDRPIRSTGDMVTWYTGRPCDRAARSHVNFCVHDSTWEASEAFALDHSPLVDAWVKNDHLGFEVFYVHAGVVHKYRPDFLVRLASGDMLVLEVKGREREQDRTKRHFLEEWIAAVSAHGGFGRWTWAVSRKPSDVHDVLAAANGRTAGVGAGPTANQFADAQIAGMMEPMAANRGADTEPAARTGPEG